MKIGRRSALVLLVSASAIGVAVFLGLGQRGPHDAEGQAGATKRLALVAPKHGKVALDRGIVLRGFTFNGTVPGPQLVVEEGDTIEISLRNDDAVAHGVSVHAANAQTSRSLGNVGPGKRATLTFEATFPGVYMYHCAPGGHGIMTHTMSGQHGMIVVEPKKKYRLEEELGRPPDLRVYIVQHEVYANGRDFLNGNALYVMFNGQSFRYVKSPIPARPGDYVRFYYLNVGPNLTSTFHAVGGIWNYAYYGGNPGNLMTGLQSVVSGPTDSWVIDWQVPGEGPFTLVSHAFGTQAIKGAVGIIDSRADAPRVGAVRSEGPRLPLPAKPKRVVDPFGIGSSDLDPPVRFHPGDDVLIEMVANSFAPKVAEVPAGSRVTWVNNDVFDLLEGERTGAHNVVAVKGPQQFASPVLEHADRFSVVLQKPGTYEYICTIHPYQHGKLHVYRRGKAT